MCQTATNLKLVWIQLYTYKDLLRLRKQACIVFLASYYPLATGCLSLSIQRCLWTRKVLTWASLMTFSSFWVCPLLKKSDSVNLLSSESNLKLFLWRVKKKEVISARERKTKNGSCQTEITFDFQFINSHNYLEKNMLLANQYYIYNLLSDKCYIMSTSCTILIW
jgi:hypothetical protein